MKITPVQEWDTSRGMYFPALSFEGCVTFCHTFEEGVAELRKNLSAVERGAITRQINRDGESLKSKFESIISVCETERTLSNQLIDAGWVPGNQWILPLKKGNLALIRNMTWTEGLKFQWILRLYRDKVSINDYCINLQSTFSSKAPSFSMALSLIDQWIGCFALA